MADPAIAHRMGKSIFPGKTVIPVAERTLCFPQVYLQDGWAIVLLLQVGHTKMTTVFPSCPHESRRATA